MKTDKQGKKMRRGRRGCKNREIKCCCKWEKKTAFASILQSLSPNILSEIIEELQNSVETDKQGKKKPMEGRRWENRGIKCCLHRGEKTLRLNPNCCFSPSWLSPGSDSVANCPTEEAQSRCHYKETTSLKNYDELPFPSQISILSAILLETQRVCFPHGS